MNNSNRNNDDDDDVLHTLGSMVTGDVAGVVGVFVAAVAAVDP